MNDHVKQLWDMPMLGLQDRELKPLKNPPTLREVRLGSVWNDFDIEAHINSEDGKQQALNWRNVITCRDEMDPQVLTYWANLGWAKELHDTEIQDKRWSCFVPLSSRKAENATRKYPLYFIMHGGITPVFEMEGYGLIEPTAKDEPFVIIPYKLDLERFLEIYHYAIEHFPIDRSRVYITSYCGGNRANAFALRYPELFAAIAPCGNPLRENYKPVLWYPDYERVHKLSMPCIHLDGLEDLTQLLPVYRSGNTEKADNPAYPGRIDNMPLARREYKVNCLRDMLYTLGCKDVTAQEVYACADSGDEVLRKVGVPADETEIKTIAGKKHYVAKLRNDAGKPWVQIVGIESMGHFPDATLGVAAWDFMRRFRRNQTNGQIEVDGEKISNALPQHDYDPDRYLHDYGNRENGYVTAWDGTPV